jgi:hypothetical protein
MRHCRWYRRAAHNLALATAAAIWLACNGSTEPVPPTTGAVEVTTSTSGVDLDPDGYMLVLDGVEVQPIGPVATATLSPLSVSTHVVGLAGVAANCQVQGGNPRGVGVAAGDTAAEWFAVTCAQVPPDAGTLDIGVATGGAAPDPDGYTVTLDGAGGWPVAVNGSISIRNVTSGSLLVELTGVAANCTVAGSQPQAVTVPSGGSAQTAFAVDCSAVTGSLQVTVTGLPAGTDAAVTVTGPGGYQAAVTATTTLDGLVPGQYTVSAGSVTSGSEAYTSTPPSRTVAVAAGETAAVTVTYVAEPRPSLDLDIAGLYLTQSVQTFTNDVPLVAGRDALLRVFVRANEANTVTPGVRVRVYRSGTLQQTYTIAAPGASTPTTVDEGTLASSWNVAVPGSLIGAGLEVLAEVDPAGSVAEGDETDNRFPASGTPAPVSVRAAAPLALTLVPVLQSANGLQGRVSNANKDEYLDLIRRIYPIPGYDATVHAVYTTVGPLQANDANGAWGTLLSELDAPGSRRGPAARITAWSSWTIPAVRRAEHHRHTHGGRLRLRRARPDGGPRVGPYLGRSSPLRGTPRAWTPAIPIPTGDRPAGYDVLAGAPGCHHAGRHGRARTSGSADYTYPASWTSAGPRRPPRAWRWRPRSPHCWCGAGSRTAGRCWSRHSSGHPVGAADRPGPVSWRRATGRGSSDSFDPTGYRRRRQHLPLRCWMAVAGGWRIHVGPDRLRSRQ